MNQIAHVPKKFRHLMIYTYMYTTPDFSFKAEKKRRDYYVNKTYLLKTSVTLYDEYRKVCVGWEKRAQKKMLLC